MNKFFKYTGREGDFQKMREHCKGSMGGGPGREGVLCWDDRDEQFTGSHPNSDSESPKEESGLPLDQPLSTADLRGDLPGPSSVPRFSQKKSTPWEREKIMNLKP